MEVAMTICKITGDYIQLNQFLKKENVASSGGEAKVMIQNQMVSVNGSIAFEIRKKLRPGDRIKVDGVGEYLLEAE